MIEIRPPRPAELDAMLVLMCEAFSLPFEPARELFYHDPYFDEERKRVLVEDGDVVSCMTVIDAPMTIGAAVVRVAGVTGVATQEKRRGRGHARQLLRETLAELAADGYGVAGLVPFSVEYYRRLGWEVCLRYLRATFPSALLPTFADTAHVRLLRDSDWSQLASLYDTVLPAHPGWCLRDEKRWRYLLDHVRSGIVLEKDGQIEGYAFFEIRSQDGRAVLRLQELVCATDRGCRGVLSALAAAGEFDEVEYLTDARGLRESGLSDLLVSDGATGRLHIEVQPGVMFRLVNFENALRQLRPNLGRLVEPVVLAARDPYNGEVKSSSVLLKQGADGIDVIPVNAPVAGRNAIVGDVRAWVQVLTGFRSLEDAIADSALYASSDRAVAAVSPCFLRRPLHLPVTDHF